MVLSIVDYGSITVSDRVHVGIHQKNAGWVGRPTGNNVEAIEFHDSSQSDIMYLLLRLPSVL